MAKTIFDLRTMLVSILPQDCICYIQPPGDESLSYPCVMIDRNKNKIRHANNDNYLKFKDYTITYIYYDIDDPVVDTLTDLPYCELDRHFKSDNLYHSVFTIFY
jgi:hypothetical protein